MSVIAKPEREDIAQLLEQLKATPAAPKEHFCAGLLWASAEAYRKARSTNEGDELEFVDTAMRLLAGTLAKLDRDAAASYLDGLADYIFAQTATGKTTADQIMRVHFIKLRSALALADAPEAGQA